MAWKEMLVMMITTYVIRLSPFVLFRKKDQESVYSKLFVLCSLCRSFRDDVSGDLVFDKL